MEFHYSFFTSALSIIFLVFFPFLVSVLLLHLKPGRKGNLRTEQDIIVTDATQQQLRNLYEQRLKRQHFQVDRAINPDLLSAERPKPTAGNLNYPIFTYSVLPMKAAFRFEKTDGGIRVKLSLWYNDFVQDTGEGAYLEGLLRLLLKGDIEEKDIPRKPHVSAKITTPYLTAFIMLFIPLLMFHPFFNADMDAGLVHGVVFFAFVNILLLTMGLAEIRKKPDELIGKNMAMQAMFLSVASAAFSIILYYHLN